MLFLIAAGRDWGGGAEPLLFFTVPWSPSVEARGQMPGSVFTRLRILRERIRETGELAPFLEKTETELFTLALRTPGFDICAALGVTLARRLMLELGMLP